MAGPIPPEKEVEHLILLVGGNPLPNMVAASVLLKDPGRVTLVHSEDDSTIGLVGTENVADRLKDSLATWANRHSRTLSCDKVAVSESDAGSIYQRVKDALENNQNRIGLHYTGGTKAMAIHAYQAVKQAVGDRNPSAVFSYLNPRTLEVYIDNPSPVTASSHYYVGDQEVIDLDGLLKLQSNLIVRRYHNMPGLSDTALAIVNFNNSSGGSRAWRNSLQGLRQNRLTTPFQRTDDVWQNWTEAVAALRAISLDQLPRPITQALVVELSLNATTPQTVGNVFDACQGLWPGRFAEVQDLCSWLDSKWLEDFTLYSLQQLPQKRRFHDLRMAAETTGSGFTFEVDVIGLRGYQLFAFACSADIVPSRLKLKLFEAYTRAAQLGGDEARTVLVCAASHQHTVNGVTRDIPAEIEAEMTSNIGRPIKVFGREDLPFLIGSLNSWLSRQVGREP